MSRDQLQPTESTVDNLGFSRWFIFVSNSSYLDSTGLKMPNKKNNTTLVTQDELMEEVTSRVTDNIRQELDQRLASFQKLFERMVPPEQPATQTSPPAARKRPAEDPPHLQPQVRRTRSNSELYEIDQHNSDSSFQPNSQPSGRRPARTPAATIMREDAGLPTSLPEVPERPVPNVNNNNNSATWSAWLGIQQPFSSQRSGLPGASPTSVPPPDMSIEDQVRYIMETTPHQLSGKVPTGGFAFPYKYVTRGPEKRRLNFNTVTLAEHIWGTFRMLDDVCTDSSIKPFILAHIKEVAEDACEYEWGTHVRRWSEEVFSMVAEKRLPDGWRSTARIQNLRTGMSRVDGARLALSTNNQHTTGNTQHSGSNYQKKLTNQGHASEALKGGPPCTAFNSSQGCSLPSGHLVNGVKQIHICSYCLPNTAAAHPHPEARCRTKQRHASAHF